MHAAALGTRQRASISPAAGRGEPRRLARLEGGRPIRGLVPPQIFPASVEPLQRATERRLATEEVAVQRQHFLSHGTNDRVCVQIGLRPSRGTKPSLTKRCRRLPRSPPNPSPGETGPPAVRPAGRRSRPVG